MSLTTSEFKPRSLQQTPSLSNKTTAKEPERSQRNLHQSLQRDPLALRSELQRDVDDLHSFDANPMAAGLTKEIQRGKMV
jgi:hypothetical protein